MRYAKGVCSMWEQERVASASTFRSAVRTSSRSTTLPARSLYVADVACETRVLAFDVVDESLGTFNTIVLFGNNFGLFGTPTKAKQLLRRLHRMTSNDARIIVESRDVERRGDADAPWHRRYRERNIARGRLPGQIRIRVRFRDVIGPWMNYPMVSPDQLREILAGTRWYVVHVFDSDDTFVAIIEKTGG